MADQRKLSYSYNELLAQYTRLRKKRRNQRRELRNLNKALRMEQMLRVSTSDWHRRQIDQLLEENKRLREVRAKKVAGRVRRFPFW